MFGRARQERGDFTERKVFAAFRDAGTLPSWLTVVEPAPAELQPKGVDAVAATDIGNLYLQIKSSQTGARNHQERHPHGHIAVVVININDPADAVRAKCLSALGNLRQQILQNRDPFNGLCFPPKN